MKSDSVKGRKLSKIFLKERESRDSLSVFVYKFKKIYIRIYGGKQNDTIRQNANENA